MKMSEIVKTLGGDRLGSGNKNKVRMHNFERSTHDLSESFKSTMGPGMLIPCYCNVGLNGDTFELKIDAGVLTIPTQAPLLGSFKLQVDYFSCPLRLYQGILHNNPINIGLKMGQVKLPKIEFRQLNWTGADVLDPESEATEEPSMEAWEHARDHFKFAENSLEKYLGLSGIGLPINIYGGIIKRALQCIPELAYYDIFKNYYANKQEENAYVISRETKELDTPTYDYGTYKISGGQEETSTTEDDTELRTPASNTFAQTYENKITHFTIKSNSTAPEEYAPKKIKVQYFGRVWNATKTLQELIESGVVTNFNTYADANEDIWMEFDWNPSYDLYGAYIKFGQITTPIYEESDLKLIPFKLENIDTMRYELLAHTTMGESFKISKTDNTHYYLPYSVLADITADGRSRNALPLNGIVVKTYQSDIFNNWVQTEWIDGENGINAITSVQVDGSFTIDALNLASKVYDMLNRIAVSGGTFQDWMEAVYGEKVARHIETPIYLGGMSSEVTFDTVVSTAATSDGPLGSLGGRGKLKGKKGGHIIVKCNEPTIIMGICSLTPRLDYAEGNMWYRTEIDSLNDLHKPNLDQIGFQDLLEESMAWWSKSGTITQFAQNRVVGKQPAWINYMTAYDKVYGDFAKTDGKAFMVLQRFYTMGENGEIADATTYIDPQKYNYVFADAQLDAQNFWVQVYTDVKARRKMSAKQIPNL